MRGILRFFWRLEIAFFLLLFLSIKTPGQNTVAISGALQDPSGAPITANGTFVRFSLRNFGSQIPGAPSIPAVIGWPDVDFTPDNNGNISGNIVTNQSISAPSGTFYHVCIWYRNQLFRCNDYVIGPSAFNLNTATPLATSPTIGTSQVITQSFACPISPASMTWTCTHNFGDTNVIVNVYDANSKQIFPDTLTITNSNVVTLTWVTAQAGTAIIMHAGNVSIATNQPNAIVSNPTGAQSISGQALTLTASVPFNFANGTGTFPGAMLAESGRPWIDITGAPYNADPTGVADSTTAIQNAHNACVAFATGPCAVYFPFGTYKASALTWSPYVPAIADSRVILTTALASGNFISISDQYGKPTPDPNSNGTTRSKTFSGNFQIINTNAANTAFAFFIGGATSANFATQLSLDGLGVSGFKSGVFKFGYNAFLIHITNFFGYVNGGSYFSILAGATNTGEGMTIDSSTFAEGATNASAAYLFSWNTTSASDLHFHNCSYDYLAGISDPAQAAINTSVNITNSHFEWNNTTDPAQPYLNVTGGISFKIVNAKFFTPGTAAISPYVGRVNGTSTLSVSNARYEFGGTIALLYDNASGTGAVLNIDPFINTANTVTTYFTKTGGAGGNVTFNGVPTNLPAAYDMSAYSLGVGILYLGGNSAATNIPQFQANSASTCAGIVGGNYILLRAGVAITECHSATGDVGLTGRLNLTAAPVGSAGNASFGASGGIAQVNNNNGTTFPVTQTIASGTSTLTSNATLAAVTSQAAITTAATNTLTTDAIEWAYATAPGAGDSLCHVSAYVTAGNVNFVRSNPTAASQNVSAIVINWRVIR